MSRKSMVLGALALSAPAILLVVANNCMPSLDDIAVWCGSAWSLLLCVIAAVAYVRLARLHSATAPANFGALAAFFSQRTDSRWGQACAAVAASAGRICCWVLPGFWLALAASNATMMIRNTWLTAFSIQNPWVDLLPSFAFAIGLYFARGRGMMLAIGTCLAIALIQIVAILVACPPFFARHHPISTKSNTAWVLDSTGAVTPYVQDTVPDPARTIPDPADPTRQIQDPSATVPKVDRDGNAVWVYNAVDTRGNVLLDTGGRPIIVPTDATGKPVPLPTGAVIAEAEQFQPVRSVGSMSEDVVPDFTPPIEQRYNLGAERIMLTLLAGFQLLALLGQRTRRTRLALAAFTLTLLIQAGVTYVLYFVVNKVFVEALANSPSSAAPPLGDIMQLIGSWAFGSGRAGWWFMMTEELVILLLFASVTLLCFDTAAAAGLIPDDAPAPRIVRDQGTNRSPRLRTWGRVGVALLVCSLGLTQGEFRSFASLYLSGSLNTARDICGMIALKLPDLLTIVGMSGALAVIVLCMSICLALLQAQRIGPKRGRLFYVMLAVIGLLGSVATLAFFLAVPLVLPRVSGKEPLCAVVLCIAFGIGGVIRRRRPQRLQGHCPVCGYDLRATPGRCPECGVESEAQVVA